MNAPDQQSTALEWKSGDANSNELESCARRCSDRGATYDAAILQTLREYVWRVLTETDDPEKAVKVLPLILRAREQALVERRASGESDCREDDAILRQIIDQPLRIDSDAANNKVAFEN